MKIFFRTLIIAVLLACAPVSTAVAQFADQATYAGTGAGTANAQTITMANVTSYADLRGVIIKYVPAATNTTSTTMTVNGFGSSPIIRKPTGTSGMAALTGGEIVTGQVTYLFFDGTFFDLVSPANLPVSVQNLTASTQGFGTPPNLGLLASVSANQLTIAIKGVDGNDPSSTNPVLIAFRDVTIANGGPKIVSLQSALSFTIASGSTMGCVSGQTCRLWILAICSSGLSCTNSAGTDTLALCAFNATNSTGPTVLTIDEGSLQTSASGTSGGSSPQNYYCGISAVSSKAIRILGYIEATEASAGVWATAPTTVQLMGPGIKKPGDVIQKLSSGAISTSTVFSTSFIASAVTQNILPRSAANLVQVTCSCSVIPAGNSSVSLGISRGSGPTVISNVTTVGASSSNATAYSIVLIGLDRPNTVSNTSYTVYGIASNVSSATMNGGTGVGGLNTSSTILLEEIQG